MGGDETFRAVDDISFIVQRGTTHAIVGESGSGKTTTARSVVGFQSQPSGASSSTASMLRPCAARLCASSARDPARLPEPLRIP